MNLPLELERPAAVQQAIEQLAQGGEERGAVFTRPEVVEAILDLAGYTPDQPLHQRRLLEPSFGHGEFLLAAVRRLLRARPDEAYELGDAIRGVEVHRKSFSATRDRLLEELANQGVPRAQALRWVDRWLVQDDYLLADLVGQFDYVVGNPPYVRQEKIAAPLLLAYRDRYSTLYDRADLYVPFFERSLDLLRPGGRLAFICANRWFKNKYGGPLRAKVARSFHLEVVIDLEGARAFQDEVMAYAAITVIRAARPGPTRIALSGRHNAAALSDIVPALLAQDEGHHSAFVTAECVALADDPWLVDVPDVLPILRRLEARFPALEEAGISVGIGVATGCDEVFIGPLDALPVEAERTLPLVMAGDLQSGSIAWSGRGIVNPWEASGELAAPSAYPRFSAWLTVHEARLRKRHTAKSAPQRWYRTIDRIDPELTQRPKLLIPDIKGSAAVVYDAGHFYPHHNLYVVTSSTWDLRVVQTILRSSAALMFVAAYCVRMSGGFLRFQAQYLRRIRVPAVTPHAADQLRALAESADQDAIDAAVLPLYGLNPGECAQVRAFAAAARVAR